MRASSFLGTAGVAVALAGLLAPGASRLLGDGRAGWSLDLMAHWVWLWWPLGAVALGWVGWRWPVRLVLGLLMLSLPWAWLPPALARTDREPTLRLVLANVHLGNRDPAPLLAWAREAPPDLIAVVELTPAYAAALQSQAGEWPHRALHPRSDAFGNGLLSRWPLQDVREVEGEGGISRLHARVMAPDGAFEVIVVHPVPPIDSHWHAVRNREFGALRPSGTQPALLLGDLNATPWSSAAPRLAAAGWRWFGGWQPTWPHRAWGIPIDAVWGQGAWQVAQRSVGPDIGSDHRPLRVGLRLAATSPP